MKNLISLYQDATTSVVNHAKHWGVDEEDSQVISDFLQYHVDNGIMIPQDIVEGLKLSNNRVGLSMKYNIKASILVEKNDLISNSLEALVRKKILLSTIMHEGIQDNPCISINMDKLNFRHTRIPFILEKIDVKGEVTMTLVIEFKQGIPEIINSFIEENSSSPDSNVTVFDYYENKFNTGNMIKPIDKLNIKSFTPVSIECLFEPYYKA